MRTRDQITEEYLAGLLENIRTQFEEYKQYIQTLWMHKDEQTMELLGHLFESQTGQDQIPLAHYHHLLNTLYRARELSAHKDHPFMKMIIQLVEAELSTLSEADWQKPDGNEETSSNIRSALSTLEGHANYRSQAEEEFAEKWDVSCSIMRNPRALESWKTFASGQSWHIRKNHDHEVALAAESILGIHQHALPDFFIMQNRDARITELENELYELREDRSKELGRIDHDLRALQHNADVAKSDHDYAATASIKHDLSQKEHEKHESDKEHNELIEDKIHEIALYRLKLSLRKDAESKLTPCERLEDYYQQLLLWTPRNLSLLLLDNIINSQINLLDPNAEHELDDRISNLRLPDMITHLGHTLELILKAVDRAKSAIRRELKLYQDTISDHGHHINHGLHPFKASFMEVDPETASQEFIAFANQKLLPYTSVEHFKKAQEKIQRSRYYPFGMLLPEPERVIDEVKKDEEIALQKAELEAQAASDQAAAPASTDDAQSPLPEDENNQPPSTLRRSARVHSSMDQLGSQPAPVSSTANILASTVAAPAPGDTNPPLPNNIIPFPVVDIQRARPVNAQRRNEYSLPVKILIGIGITLALAIFVAGGVSAVIFSGGTAGLALAVGVVAAISGMVVIGGIISAYQNHAQRTAERHAREARAHRSNRDFEDDIHRRPPPSNSQAAGYSPLPQDAPPSDAEVLPPASADGALKRNSMFALPAITSQPVLVSPGAQNQEKTTASTPSASRR